MAQSDEELVRQGYGAFSGGDMDTLRRLFSDDAVWHVSGRSRLSGDYQGADEILGYFRQTMELTEGNFQVELHDVVANDNHVVGLHHASGQRGDKRLESNEALVFHLRDGRVTEVWQLFEDPYQAEDFFS